jgi:hypothetical protein
MGKFMLYTFYQNFKKWINYIQTTLIYITAWSVDTTLGLHCETGRATGSSRCRDFTEVLAPQRRHSHKDAKVLIPGCWWPPAAPGFPPALSGLLSCIRGPGLFREGQDCHQV